ncbi:DUF2339 domain-containing protein [bacterium]|nr:MAG: DUF2339 domain-containing protein [bacterium]
MSILLSDPEFADLRGRVIELEALLKQLETKKQLQSSRPPIPPAPHLTPQAPPVVSPPPPPKQPDWPSQWSPPIEVEKAPAPLPQFVAPPQPPAPSPKPVQVTPPPPVKAEEKAPVPPAPALQPKQQPVAPPRKEEPFSPPTIKDLFPLPDSPANQPPQKSLLEWENLIGGRLALWVGALCLFLALASFIVYVGKTLPPPTPSVRVAAGFVGSFVLFVCGLAARKRGQRWFVDGLLGTGLAVGFLSVWGGGPHFNLWPLAVSLLGFSVYSAAGIGLSYRRNSQALLILSSIGGFLTPVLVRNNNAQHLAFVFLSYLLVLNIGIVSVCAAKKWREIIYGAFITTVLLVTGWGSEANLESLRPMLWVFATLGWVLFAGSACFRPLIWGEKSETEDTPLLLSATGLYATTAQWLLFPLLKSFPGAFSLVFTLVLGALWWLSKQRVPKDEALHTIFLALTCVAGALFIPIQFGQNGLVWGWAAQSVALVCVGRKSGHTMLLNTGRLLWGLSVIALAGDFMLSSIGTNSPLDAFSLRLLFCLAATAVCLWDEDDETWMPIYGLFLSWGGAYWLGRMAWLMVPRLGLVAPKYAPETELLLGATSIALWALFLWRWGWWRRQNILRADSWLMLVLALCAIAGVGLWGNAPLVGLRIVAFIIGAAALVTMGFWHARHEEGDQAFTHEAVAVTTSCWLTLGMTIEIAAYWHNGTFALPTMGSIAWFALCASWSIFAAGAGALSLARTWPKMWALAESLFAISTGVLLLESLLVPDSLVPVANMRLVAFVVAWLVALLAQKVDGDSQSPNKDWWLLALSLLPLWATTQELWNVVAANQAYFGPEWKRFASLSVSLCWSFYAMLCLIIGISKRVQNLRIGALSLGAVAVCKVFLFDLSFLDGGLRVLSLGGLGAALLFISWLYSRFVRPENNATA